LQLNLKRVVPEALKPRRIAVQVGRPAVEQEPQQAAIANEQGEQSQAA
jgi:hypothetical protein